VYCSTFEDGGWLRTHPLPADKGSFGKFEALSQQNKQVIQRILESNSSMSFTSSQDAELLRKLRQFYSSCLDERRLDDRGAVPLLDFVQTLKTLYRGGERQIPSAKGLDKSTDLTAALAYVHSRGKFNAGFLLIRRSNVSCSYLQALMHSFPLVLKVMMV
jgi:endothelin-converting enzyme